MQTNPQLFDEADLVEVTKQMKAFVAPFGSPLAHEVHDNVRLRGTGNVVELLGLKMLLTCEHVVTGAQNLAFGLSGTEDMFSGRLVFGQAAYPYDVAIGILPRELWESGRVVLALAEDQWAFTHHPTEDELLFFRGYAGENSNFAFETLKSDASSYLTQEIRDFYEPNSRFFFNLHHRPEQVKFADQPIRFCDPSGFSGSLVWNTRFVQCKREGLSWEPKLAQITGMVCRWRIDDPSIKVLKVEHLRSYLLRAISDMQAAGHLD